LRAACTRYVSFGLLAWCGCAPDLDSLTSGDPSTCASPLCVEAGAALDAETIRDAGGNGDASLLSDASAPDGSGRPDGPDTFTDALLPSVDVAWVDVGGDVRSGAGDGASADAGDGKTTSPSDGGADAGPLRLVLYTFDRQGGSSEGGADAATDAAANTYDWVAFPAGPLSLADDDSNLTNPTKGALLNRVSWKAYDTTAYLEKTYSPQVDFSAYSKMHMWVKLPAASPTLVNVLPYIYNPGGAGVYAPFTTASSLPPGVWVELISNLPTGPGSPLAQTRKVGLQIRARKDPNASPDASPDASGPPPPPMDIEIDNIWLE